MKSKVLALIALVPCLASCGTVFMNRRLVAGTPVGGYGQPMGVGNPKKGNVYTADQVVIDLPALIESYAGQKPTTKTDAPQRLETAIVDFEAHYAGNDKAEAAARNSIVYTIMAASDQNCQVFIEYLHGNQVLVRSLSSSLTTLFTAAATVTTPVSAAKNLTALGTVSSGVGTAIDANAFSNSTVETIVSGIKADRAEFKTVIAKDLTQDYINWPLSAGIADAIEYHNRCDAVSAMGYLQGTAAETIKASSSSSSSPAAPVAPVAAAAASSSSSSSSSVASVTAPLTAPPSAIDATKSTLVSANTVTTTSARPGTTRILRKVHIRHHWPRRRHHTGRILGS